ncbi:MAG: AMP-binding protein [Acidimicrobiia bacterium]|nr:AMP-binding protein [Acidimicrobiia bacterium]
MSTGTGATTFAQAWSRAVAEHDHETFLLFEGPDGHVAEWTYADFDMLVARMAKMLTDTGVGEGCAVHLALTNSPAFVAIWLATIRLGAWIVPSDPMGRTPELADHIERTQPVIGFCSVERADIYRAAAPAAMPIVEIDESDVSLALLPGTEFADWASPALTDRAAVMFTSGTTGRPKGVEITQANYAFAGKAMAEAAALTAGDRHIVVLPLFHANAQYYSFASAIWAGASVALMHTFSASSFLPQCARHRATCASLFAAPIRMILARGSKTEGVSLRNCWFAQNIAADQHDTISDWLGCRPRQLYGMTETIPAVLTDEAADPRPDSMGRVTGGCEVEVHDSEGRPVPPGVVGELVVGGERGITLFAGYLDDAQTTAASFDRGWFRTGDRASTDETGRFYFNGRRSDVLKVAGENVSTVEVEAVLSAHPDVLEASVIGSHDSVRDEVPVAFVVAADAARPPTEAELTEWCTERLAKAKVPREITLIDELPRTSVGKIRKFLLKESVS